MDVFQAPIQRVVARVRGADPLGFLDATTTQDLASLGPGRGAVTCLLDDKGRLLAVFRVFPLWPDEVLLDAEPASADALGGWLVRVAPLSGCEVAVEDGWEALAVRGSSAADAVRTAMGAEPPAGEGAFVRAGEVIAVRVEWGGPGWDLLAPAASLPEVGAPLDAAAVESARIAGGAPRFGIDVEPGTLVNEVPYVERAVAHGKGCYPGQESVARVRNLGKVRKRLVVLAVDGAVPAAGAPVLAGGAQAGRVTSAAPGGPRGSGNGGVALAVLRSEVPAGARVVAGGAPAVVREI